MHPLKRLVPRTLFGRSLVIIVTPFILLQVISADIFYERHWDTVSRYLAIGLVGDISAVISMLEAFPEDDDRAFVLWTSRVFLGLDTRIEAGAVLETTTSPDDTIYLYPELIPTLSARLGRPFLVASGSLTKRVAISVQLNDGVMHVVTSRKRLFSSTTYIFIMWTVGSSIVLLAVAIYFLRNQMRSIRRLAVAADAFGKGRDAGDFKPEGAREVRQAAAAFIAMRERIRLQITQRTEMLAGVSHDLRTPLTSLQGYLETLLIKEGALTEAERRHYLELAAKHGKRLSQLTAELFELAMLESQGRELHFEPFSLAELVQDVAQKFELEAEKHALRLETEIPPGAPFVSGDIALIERVLENLIENAIKYTPQGGRIRLSLFPRPGCIAARVSDTGVGIPEHEVPHIFERFYRVEKSRGEGPGGTGLGLAIARRILELHGSPIEVESKPGRGTSFSFELPTAA